MPDILERIMERKREEVAARKRRRSEAEIARAADAAGPPKGFAAALRARSEGGTLGLIAEIKKSSPSKGLIRAEFEPAAHATSYQSGGATCLSVLTDGPGFDGEDAHLIAARNASTLPILRKDFMWEPYQIAESRALAADAILIILAVMDDRRAADLLAAARAHGMDALVEVHDRAELDRAGALGADLVGVNNRDLRSFVTRLETFETLAPHAPKNAVLIAESGVSGPADARRMRTAGAAAILVGESLMRAADPGAAAAALLAAVSEPSSTAT